MYAHLVVGRLGSNGALLGHGSLLLDLGVPLLELGDASGLGLHLVIVLGQLRSASHKWRESVMTCTSIVQQRK